MVFDRKGVLRNKKEMRSVLIFLVIQFTFFELYPQTLIDCTGKIRSGQLFTNETELNEWLIICKNDTTALFDCLNKNLSDSLLSDKLANSIFLIKTLSVKSSSEKVKRAAVKLFLSISRAKDSGISVLSVNSLKSYSSAYFDNSDIGSISVLIEKYPVVYKESVELAGYIGNPEFLSKMREVFPDSRSFSKAEKWASYKAMARLGDKEAIDYCIQRVSSLPLNDQVIDILYPDLIYIHRKEAFNVIIKALNSDETLCSSSNPDSDFRIVCGYRIMELLAPVIVDFPVNVLPSGDLDTKDYKKSLQKVREWFKQKGDNYTITNSF